MQLPARCLISSSTGRLGCEGSGRVKREEGPLLLLTLLLILMLLLPPTALLPRPNALLTLLLLPKGSLRQPLLP